MQVPPSAQKMRCLILEPALIVQWVGPSPGSGEGEGADRAKRGSPLASEAKTSVDAVRAAARQRWKRNEIMPEWLSGRASHW